VDRPRAGSCILLCSLGSSWAVIPEVFGWLAPRHLDLYAHHPQRDRLDAAREQFRLHPPDELWVCTTEGAQAQRSVEQLHDWWCRLGRPVALRVWTGAGTDQLATADECAHLRELTFRLVLHATAASGPEGQVVVSLAGGRKTMSADLQDAAGALGAAAWLHVVGPDPLPKELREAGLDAFLAPLSPDLAAAVTPLVVGRGTRSEILDAPIDDGHRIDVGRYPLSVPSSGQVVRWPQPGDRVRLHEDLSRLQSEGQRLIGNLVAQQAREDTYENWPALLRLPAGRIEELRAQVVSPALRSRLVDFPKADLHRHVGGCLDLGQQRTVAEAIWQTAAPAERDAAKATIDALLREPGDWPWNWPARLAGPGRALASAALLLHTPAALLERQLYGVTEPRVALKASPPHGFAAYERPGELQGSALLSHPGAVAPYARALVDQARAEGLMLVELRCSPHKYRAEAPTGFLRDLESALRDAGAQTRGFDAAHGGPRFGVLWIVDRRQPENIGKVVGLAARAFADRPGFVLGIDLAGDESVQGPQQLASAFAPAFEACMRVTIHAGEGETAENIWQAAYHLHADRIGHGLSIAEHPALAQRFRDRGIAIELCPTSNREVVGFRDPAHPDTALCPPYPLRSFMQEGLPFVLCTDNPGISRTTLADEIVTASRITAGGLTTWDALAIIRMTFAHAFVPAAERAALRRAAEARLFSQLS
jgi:adenosine deaminase